MSIVLIGMKASGKTTVGKILAKKLNMRFVDMDNIIEKKYKIKSGQSLSFREIFKKYGEKYFTNLESECLSEVCKETNGNIILACGGRTPLTKRNQNLLKKIGPAVYLDVDKKELLSRILKNGLPAFLKYTNNPGKSLDMLLKVRNPIYEEIADIKISCSDKKPDKIAGLIIKKYYDQN
ncbi:shikimate kinase [Patescibacteria group bacterium]|nr:shikimate kinase [Patescibacteria group bacterium]MCL5797612.1 shikimate kinase [Patescibacteria group bacterium]